MKSKLLICLFTLMCMTFGSCTPEGDEYANETSSRAALGFCVGKLSTQTRMSDAIVQETGQTFRGLQDIRIIPFDVRGTITINDRPKAFAITDLSSNTWSKTNAQFYYYPSCSIARGVASFLVYARAATGGAAESVRGALTAEYGTSMIPSDIRFSLTQIRNTSEAHADATTLAAYMTAIANAQYLDGDNHTFTWKSSANSTLRAYYLNFIAQYDDAYKPMAGSSLNIQKRVAELRTRINTLSATFGVDSPEKGICNAIITAIDNNSTLPANYPASIGLPAGAAVLMWTGTQFAPQTETTTLASINGITRYAYPAELYYFVNSRICTSNEEVTSSIYSNSTAWTGSGNVLSEYEYTDGVVTGNTQAVAIKNPLQYAVGRLDYTIDVQANMQDAKEETVTATKDNFPLTAMLVGNQHTMKFDFTPKEAVQSDADVRFAYDTNVMARAGKTLVLQTYDNEEVTLVGEFLNDSGQDFMGADGIVYNGTKFYLVGKVKPSDANSGAATEYVDRVFTQDAITTMTMKVTSLAKAYNVAPDLLSPHLEVGVEMIIDWVGATATDVPLE